MAIGEVISWRTRNGREVSNVIFLLGTTITRRSILLSQIHNAVEIIGMITWIALVIRGHEILGAVVLAVTLTVEHILALAAGKQA